MRPFKKAQGSFESFVNSKGCKTMHLLSNPLSSLRALLIQKDVKP